MLIFSVVDFLFMLETSTDSFFLGIPETGIVDEATTKLMQTPRCGVKDVTGRLSGVKRKRRYTLQGTRWMKKVSGSNTRGV